MKKILADLAERNIEFVDLKLTDLSGKLHHITFPLGRLETTLAQGVGFDGSSLGGFRDVASSDLILRPDVSRFMIDPFYEYPTASFYGDIYEPDAKTPFPACPRNILKKVVAYIRDKGFADSILVLPEFEFYIFDHVDFYAGTTGSWYEVSSCEEELPSGLDNAYHIAAPLDAFSNLRSRMVKLIGETGVELKYHHHEAGRFAQAEIETGFLDVAEAGDVIQTIKYFVKNIAHSDGVYATFMPKPLAGEPGSGMHLHIQMWKEDRNVFARDADENELSQTALSFLGGIIKHAPALCAFTNPATNSYLRLTGGMEAPAQVFHSRANRKAALRVPGYVRGARDLRFEYRVPDGIANPYLALAGVLLAGLDGITEGMNPGPLVVDEPESGDDRFPYLPRNLRQALGSLRQDSGFLTREGLFPEEMIEKWIKTKEMEIEEISSYPTPAEFVKYFWL